MIYGEFNGRMYLHSLINLACPTHDSGRKSARARLDFDASDNSPSEVDERDPHDKVSSPEIVGPSAGNYPRADSNLRT